VVKKKQRGNGASRHRDSHLTGAGCSYLLPAEIRLGLTVNSSPQQRSPRVLASLALLAVALTFLAAQLDFVRRNHIGITPERYWRPQLLQIWLPGLGLALLLLVLAFVLHRWGRRA
jgi:hypothetical protein